MFGEFWGPRLEYIFRNALLALIDCPETTLLSVQRFLIDSRYRKIVLAHCTDPGVRDFWEVEYARMPQKLQAEAISPIQNKVGQFTLSPQLRNIIGQPKSALHMRDIMDEGKVLLVNLSKGRLGDDVSALLGSRGLTSATLTALLEAFDGWRGRMERDGLAPVRARWLELADTIGRRVSVDGVTGVAVDLDVDGALVLEDGARRHRVVAGELEVV